MQLPKIAIFDVGGTLIEQTNFDFNKGFKYLYDLFSLDESWDDFLVVCKKVLTLIKQRDETNLEVSFSSLFNYLIAYYDLDDSLYNKEDVEYMFSQVICDSKLKENVFEILNYFNNCGVQLYVLSNSMFKTSTIKKDLERFNILSYFKDVISTGDHLVRKPSTALFEIYLHRFNKQKIDNSLVVYIGNEYEKDIVTPLKLNMQGVHISKEYKQMNGYLQIDNYLNLIKELENE